MKKGYPAGYSVRTFHGDQKRILGNKAIQDYKVCVGLVEDFFYGVNKTIIRDHYEFKIPSLGGYLRISISKRGLIFWFWDKSNDYCRLTRKRYWSFEPVVGWKKPVEIGHRGLKKWIMECKVDPYKPKYSVIKKFRRKKIK